jgi:hypothetical protein
LNELFQETKKTFSTVLELPEKDIETDFAGLGISTFGGI